MLVCCHQWQLPLNSPTVHARRCTIGAFSPLLQRANVDPANIILCSGPALDPFWFVTDHGTPSYLLQNSCQVSWRRRRLYVKLLDQCRLNPPVWFSARRLTQSGPVDSECESTATKGYQRLPEGATTLCVVLIATHMSMISGQAKPIPVEK